MTGVIVTMRDVRAVKGCSAGARHFAQQHGLDWTSFLENGVEAEWLEATGDVMAIKLAAAARARVEAERGV